MSHSNATDHNVNNLVIKSSTGTLFRLHGFTPWRDKYLQVFDATSSPTTNDIPVITVPVRDGYVDLDFGTDGRVFTNGIVVAISTDWGTYQGGFGSSMFDAQYS